MGLCHCSCVDPQNRDTGNDLRREFALDQIRRIEEIDQFNCQPVGATSPSLGQITAGDQYSLIIRRESEPSNWQPDGATSPYYQNPSLRQGNLQLNRQPNYSAKMPHHQNPDLRPDYLVPNMETDYSAKRPHLQNPDQCPYNMITYVALYDYNAKTELELSFKKGDQLEVADDGEDGWWLALSCNSGEEGFIPCNYVAKVHSLQSEPWYFGKIKRAEAEKQLLLPQNDQDGTFLIRERQSEIGNYSLSVRHGAKVEHYMIEKLNEEGYTIDEQCTFHTLSELTQHYMRNADGICVKLQRPCIVLEKPQTIGLSYTTEDHWEIDRTSLLLKHKLGSGNFGEVWEGLWNKFTPVAIKTLKEGTMDKEEFLKEVTIMKKLHHPRLIQLFAVCTVKEPIYIVTELMINGSLLTFLRSTKGGSLKLPELIGMSTDVASGMAYLEAKNFIHRDLAARNVLVGENSICKVADFGLARAIKDDVYISRVGARFPVKWTAPEGINYNTFTVKSDVWSFGILLFEIFTYGKVPYPGMSSSDVLDAIDRGYRMSCPPNCTKNIYSLMLECWKQNPIDRPTFDILQILLEDIYVQVNENPSKVD